MAQKIILLMDPGIDNAFALVVALFSPEFEVLAVATTAGNVVAGQSTESIQGLIEYLDPPRLPRIGRALPEEYEANRTALHGNNGLGNIPLKCVSSFHAHDADKLIVDICKSHRNEVKIVCLGPLTTLCRALDRDAELPKYIKSIIVIGGNWRESGDAGAVSEFRFHCDPQATRRVLRMGMPITLIPLDVGKQFILAPAELQNLLLSDHGACNILRKMIPFALRSHAEVLGIEGLRLHSLAAVAWMLWPNLFSRRTLTADVETTGELTKGMLVVDIRPDRKRPNVDIVDDMHFTELKGELHQLFQGLFK